MTLGDKELALPKLGSYRNFRLIIFLCDRCKGDQGRAMSFINAFSTSNIPSYLTRWATHQAGTNQLGKPIAITPQAYLSK